jgi:hypothetical protein
MADGDDQVRYTILNLGTNQTTNSSREFTGKGRATYVNGDIYEGDYVDGVIALNARKEPEWASTCTRRAGTATRAAGRTITRKESAS